MRTVRVRTLAIGLVVAVTLAACGGDDSDTGGNADADDSGGGNSGALDPCTLADESILETYFGTATPEPERSEAGPIDGCAWSDANANSVLIQTSQDFELFRPDPCQGCVDVTFGDDGYASPSPIQSTAKVVDGSMWLSVTTTGFADDGASITELLEQVFGIATG